MRESWYRYFRGKDGQFAHLRDSFFSPSLPPRLPIDRRKCNRLLLKKSQDPRSSAEESYPNLMMLLKFPQTPSHNRGHLFTWFRFRFSCTPRFRSLHFAFLPRSLRVRTNRNGPGPCQNRTVIFGLTKPPIASETSRKPKPSPLHSRIASAEPRGAGVETLCGQCGESYAEKCESRREDALFVSARYCTS